MWKVLSRYPSPSAPVEARREVVLARSGLAISGCQGSFHKIRLPATFKVMRLGALSYHHPLLLLPLLPIEPINTSSSEEHLDNYTLYSFGI